MLYGDGNVTNDDADDDDDWWLYKLQWYIYIVSFSDIYTSFVWKDIITNVCIDVYYTCVLFS